MSEEASYFLKLYPSEAKKHRGWREAAAIKSIPAASQSRELETVGGNVSLARDQRGGR